MVASVAGLSSASQAASYYESDDYYAKDGGVPSEWQGKGADALGLSGEVDRRDFVEALEGRLPDGTQLGTMRGGKVEHRPGWDVTFSAPKSVSVMAEVAGDRRLVAAHDKAVATAVSWLERHGAATRIRQDGAVQTVHTGKFVAATFRHNTSRAQDPQLHTHAVLLNMTQDGEGNWRSLESLAFFRLYKDAGAVYRQALAFGAQELGYAIREGRGSTFEIEGVPEAAIKAFSSRAAMVEEKLAERGKTRADASAAEKAVITLDTRERKQAVDRDSLVPVWRETAAQAGFDELARRSLVSEAEINAKLGKGNLAELGRAEAAATLAVSAAARSLSERDAVFGAAVLEARAGEYAMGRATPEQISAAVQRTAQAGELVARVMNPGPASETPGFATREAVLTEQRMLARELEGRGAAGQEFSRIKAARAVAREELRAGLRGHSWSAGQRDATIGLLAGADRVSAVQGYAGTAKTSTVLATYATALQERGYRVRAFGPTAASAGLLGKAVGVEGRTLAKALHGSETLVAEARQGKEAWILDEASMASARDMERLIGLVGDAGARLVLVGDVRQLGSVGAGRAFAQLQDAGMPTFVLDRIVRQQNDLTREAVEAVIAGDGVRALGALAAGGGKVVEADDVADRHRIMAADFAALSPQERARTIVMDTTREGREALTAAIRGALRRDGTLGEQGLLVPTLESKGLTKEEAKHARNYERGDVVIFGRDQERHGVQRGEAYRVERTDPALNRIELRDNQDRRIDWQPDRWGRGQSEAFTERLREFRTGDKLQFTRNDREAGRVNGRGGIVTAIDSEARTITVEAAHRREHVLHADSAADRHVRHGWVQTIHASQGATADRAMVHLESFRSNTVDARSAYVAISRARDSAAVYTDSKEGLAEAIMMRSGDQSMALASGPAAQAASQSAAMAL